MYKRQEECFPLQIGIYHQNCSCIIIHIPYNHRHGVFASKLRSMVAAMSVSYTHLQKLFVLDAHSPELLNQFAVVHIVKEPFDGELQNIVQMRPLQQGVSTGNCVLH